MRQYGQVQKCGGIVTITLDYDGCRYCGGTGRCPACNGGGYFQVGYRDNPNKAQIIKQIRDILYPNPPRPNPYPNPSPFPSPNPNPVDPDDPDPDDPDDDDDDSSSRRGGIGAGYLVGGILGAGVLGWLGFRYFRR